MDGNFLEPWVPPPDPDLVRLALEAADEAGRTACDAWPERSRGGVGFGALPPFLAWHGRREGQEHLVLLQAREAGALVPGSRTVPLPAGWLEALDLEALAAPLARHPDFPGGASVHVVGIAGRGLARVRTRGRAAPDLVAEVLARVTVVADWEVAPGPPAPRG